jgi:hypothetical protein
MPTPQEFLEMSIREALIPSKILAPTVDNLTLLEFIHSLPHPILTQKHQQFPTTQLAYLPSLPSSSFFFLRVLRVFVVQKK